MRFSGVIGIGICVVVALPFFVSAHGTGVSYEETSGEYIVDIGYDPEFPQPEDRMVFDFGLFTDAKKVPAEFEYVWVRIEHERRTLLATGVRRADLGPTSLLLALPRDISGELVIHARYQKGDDTLADVSFTLPIAQPPVSFMDYIVPVGAGLAGALVTLAGVGMYMFVRKRGAPIREDRVAGE